MSDDSKTLGQEEFKIVPQQCTYSTIQVQSLTVQLGMCNLLLVPVSLKADWM